MFENIAQSNSTQLVFRAARGLARRLPGLSTAIIIILLLAFSSGSNMKLEEEKEEDEKQVEVVSLTRGVESKQFI